MTTDRAKRYAANRHVTDDPKAGCLFCGSKRNLTVDHLSGDESDGAAANLAYLCKSCNTRKGVAFKKAGIGRLTHQYNPYLGLDPSERKNFSQLGFDFPPRADYDQARASDRKRKQAEHAQALKRRREEKAAERKRLAASLAEENRRLDAEIKAVAVMRKKAQREGDKGRVRSLTDEMNYLAGIRSNPAGGIRTANVWGEAVAASLGRPSVMSIRTAAERIRATSPATRRKLAGQLSRVNPGKIPTYAQYAWAVGMYDHGNGDPALAEIIHRTPKAKRSEYTRIINARKKEHGTEHRTGTYRTAVPF